MTKSYSGKTTRELVNSITDFVTAGEDIPRGLVQAIRLRIKNKPEEFDFMQIPSTPVFNVTLTITSRELNVILGLLYRQIADAKAFVRDYPDVPANDSIAERIQENELIYEKLNTLLKRGGE